MSDKTVIRPHDGESRISMSVQRGSEVSFGPEAAPIASDMVCLVYVNNVIVGWGDDYGTARAHPADPDLTPDVRNRVEKLIEVACALWEVEAG